jgi:hypothetical protein
MARKEKPIGKNLPVLLRALVINHLALSREEVIRYFWF